MPKIDDKLNNELLSQQTLLVISPHPDDAVIGCGGLMAKIKSLGGKVYVLTITVGDEPQYGSFSKMHIRESEEKKAMNYLKADGYEIALKGDKFHLKLDTVPQKDIIDLIEKKSECSIENVKPTIVAIPSLSSENQDHIAVSKAAFTALRPRPSNLKHFPDIVISYEQGSTFWSIDLFKPDFFVDVSDFLSVKLTALSYYKTQIPKSGFSPRTIESIEILAKLRGTQICTKAAEAFESLRIKF